jgi:hypothetical protein
MQQSAWMRGSCDGQEPECSRAHGCVGAAPLPCVAGEVTPPLLRPWHSHIRVQQVRVGAVSSPLPTSSPLHFARPQVAATLEVSCHALCRTHPRERWP